ncbi:hypothetical protein D805_1673 [Bifidobacterium thermophilum RBL67]|uniref:Uncharacterized protein n=1 Tax=Bifidobacterium thermophilum RBL67 TaxID=1254439 RepID=M4REI6_9BIFI|nr:hypothetical protein D805_1673 [Bifidobacterium thermophilum RBL67]
MLIVIVDAMATLRMTAVVLRLAAGNPSATRRNTPMTPYRIALGGILY